MPNERLEFSAMMERIREGSSIASQELVTKYGSHILRVVRQRLDKALRPKFDSQDFVQEVWASFFAFRPERIAFDQPGKLVAFLTEMAQNKVVDEIRQRLQLQKHNINREYSLEQTRPSPADALVNHGPSPEEIAIAREEWECLLRNQPTQYRRILELLHSGLTHEEVAHELGLNEKTVRRLLGKLSARPSDGSK